MSASRRSPCLPVLRPLLASWSKILPRHPQPWLRRLAGFLGMHRLDAWRTFYRPYQSARARTHFGRSGTCADVVVNQYPDTFVLGFLSPSSVREPHGVTFSAPHAHSCSDSHRCSVLLIPISNLKFL